MLVQVWLCEMDVFIKYIIILIYKNQYERYENGAAGTGTGIESTPVPVPVPVSIPVGGGDFPPMRGGTPTGAGIPRPVAISRWRPNPKGNKTF